MGQEVIYSIVSLSGIGAVAAVILYFVAQKFNVIEDPRIDTVEEALPGANCGGCGFAGCRAFAESIVKNESLEGMNCPVGGADTMQTIAKALGMEAVAADPLLAVVRCNGSKCNTHQKNVYDGAKTCQYAHAIFSGENGCSFGCFGLGDCVFSCDFDAIEIDPETNLPVVNDKCVACGACVKACPRNIIELRPKGRNSRRIFVSCVNKEKGGAAKKNCNVACIGCSKCFKVCAFDAITIENNLAYIDGDKCKLCRKCVVECPTGAIHELNFPPRKEKPAVVAEKKTPAGTTATTEAKKVAEVKSGERVAKSNPLEPKSVTSTAPGKEDASAKVVDKKDVVTGGIIPAVNVIKLETDSVISKEATLQPTEKKIEVTPLAEKVQEQESEIKPELNPLPKREKPTLVAEKKAAGDTNATEEKRVAEVKSGEEVAKSNPLEPKSVGSTDPGKEDTIAKVIDKKDGVNEEITSTANVVKLEANAVISEEATVQSTEEKIEITPLAEKGQEQESEIKPVSENSTPKA